MYTTASDAREFECTARIPMQKVHVGDSVITPIILVAPTLARMCQLTG